MQDEKKRFNFLDVVTEVKNGKIIAHAEGLLGHIFDPMIYHYFLSASNRKILAERDGGFTYTLYHPPHPSKAGMKLMVNKIREKMLNVSVPTTATLAITYNCQCDCRHCSAMRYHKKEGAELSTEELKRVIEQTLALGACNITFTGGETILRKDLPELIKHVNKEEGVALMFSNGLLLTKEKVAELKEAGLYAIYVSLDSPVPDIHDGFRRITGAFEKAVQGIKNALAGGLLVGISTYASHSSIEKKSIDRIMDLAVELGVHEVTIFDVVPTGRLLDNKDLLLTKEDHEYLINLEEKYNRRTGLPGVIAQSKINSPIGSGCFAGYYQFYMTAYGDVCPCDFTPFTFGNVREKSVQEIWQSIVTHPAYCKRSAVCRMQNPEFRKKYIDPLPDDVPLPTTMPIYKDDERLAKIC